MALPKEPRQKMINIMYLVLTAILALNVSSEILNAFKTIEDSFAKSNDGLKVRSAKLISDFDAEQNAQFADKIVVWKPRAEKVRDLSDSVFAYIDMLKSDLKKESGQKVPDGPFKEDDLEASTRMFLNGKDGQTRGEQLHATLTKYKAGLLAIDPSLAKQVANLPDFTNIPKSYSSDNVKQLASMNPAKKWANVYFHMTPTVASLAILSKFQNDIRNSQTQLIEYCYSQINSVSLPITDFGVIASANATVVMSGDEVAITAGLGGFNKDSKPTITIDGTNVPIGADGNGVYKMAASTPGDYTKHIVATYLNPNTGKQETKTADVKFKVGIPTGLNVSADATRFFYAGAPSGNPISISGAAGGAGSIQVTAVSGVTDVQKTGNGTYSVYCNALGTAVLKVSDGKSTTTVNIPVKKLPDPQSAYVFGTLDQNSGQGGSIGASEFKLQSGLKAVLPEDFVFKGIEYKVKSFILQFSGKGYNGTESMTVGSFSGASALMSRCTQGSQVVISDIVFVDAANIEHKLKSRISYTLK
jgi:gliding motility-associated protein GldM